MAILPPELLSTHHCLDAFDCGHPTLDDWLHRRARNNLASGASRTFVVSDQTRVVAYYALAAGSVALADAAGSFRRNMPDPVPVVILGRLAVDRLHQGQGFGRALVRDAAKRVLAAADTIGIRGLLVHAIDEEARSFYLRVGFRQSPTDPMTLMASISSLRESL